MIISPQEWVFFIIFVPFAHGEVVMKVTAFTKDNIKLSCQYESAANQTADYLQVFQRSFLCLHHTAKSCRKDYNYRCNNMHCSDENPGDINILPFRVYLNGSCGEKKDIRCAVTLDGTGKSEEEASIDLYQESDPPVIYVNDTNPIEASCKPVEIKCNVSNLCYQAELEIFVGAILENTTTTYITYGSRLTAIATTEARFVRAGNYTVICKDKKNENRSSKLKLTVDRPREVKCRSPTLFEEGHLNTTATEVIGDNSLFNPLTIASITTAIAVILSCSVLVIILCILKRRFKYREPPGMSEQEDSICGIWVKEDEKDGEKVLDFICRRGKEVWRANIHEESFVQEIPRHTVYFALISSHSLNNQGFLASLRLILWLMSNWKYGLVLVLVEKEDSLNLNDYVDESLVPSLEVRRVKALPKLDDCLPQLARKLRVPKYAEASYGFGDIGVGLAWNYFYGFLALVLPEMRKKFEMPETFKKPDAKMSPFFIIIIPLSSHTPAKLSDVDARISTIGLFDEFKKSRAGQPERSYKTSLHQIELNSEDLYFFCGEYSTPVLSLNKMLDDRKMTQVEMMKQIQLFKKTLKSILQSHPSCGDNAAVLSFTDVSTLANHLCDHIKNPDKEGPIVGTAVKPATKVAEGLALSYFYNYLTIIGPKMADRIKQEEYYIKGKMPSKLFILLPYSCFCHPELKDADEENIKTVGKLQPLVIDVAGNERYYDTSVHEITAGGEEYFACVEYCTPVLVMYEMAENHNQTGLSPLQKAAELRIFYEILYDLLYGPSAPHYGSSFELVYYDDKESQLSTLSVDESLQGSQHDDEESQLPTTSVEETQRSLQGSQHDDEEGQLPTTSADKTQRSPQGSQHDDEEKERRLSAILVDVIRQGNQQDTREVVTYNNRTQAVTIETV